MAKKTSTGNCSTGDESTGNRSTGNWSTGNWSTGNRSTGNRSTGCWSTNDKSTGHFCTEETKNILVFNKDCTIEDWNNCDKPSFLYFNLTEWVADRNMTDQEKVDNDTSHTTGGYLKSYKYKEAFRKSWDKAEEADRKKVLSLPNFDNAVFLQISGIDVEKELAVKPTCAGKIVEVDGKKYKLTEV